MKNTGKWVALVLLAAIPLFAGYDLAPYQAYVDSLLPEVQFGLSIRSVTTGEELANINGEELFTPASTMKTLSTATALHFLPLDYSAHTKFSLWGLRDGNVFTGKLNVRGEGDPNISARYYEDPLQWLYAVADSIHSLGIDTLKGVIELDTTHFVPPWKPEHWRSDFYDFWYGAEVTPLQFNDNSAVIRIKPATTEGDTAIISALPDVGYVKIVNKLVCIKAPLNKRGRKTKLKWSRALDPTEPVVTVEGEYDIESDSSQFVIPVRGGIGYFRAAFLTALRERGLVFVEDSTTTKDLPKLREFSISATPLLSMLDEINQRSQNLHAETLFRNAAASVFGVGSVENGKKLERMFLAEIGVDSSAFEVYDGCGLAPKNKLKPSAETQMLAAMARHPKAKYYINSFASPKIGSGSKRMYTLKYPWATRFKTGYIAEVHGLAGYIFSHSDTLAVAMYLNKTGKNKDNDCKDVMDSMWVKLVEWANSGYPSLFQMKDLWLAATGVKGLDSRLEYFSRKLMGTPYKLGPMGEGHIDPVEPKPLVYLDSVDCVTYLEHTLALAEATSEDSLFNVLQRIRYIDGKISYRTRKHYLLADWVGEGKFARVIPMENDTSIVRTLPKNEFFKSKRMKYLVNGEEAEDPKVEIRYIPYDKACQWAKEPHSDTLKVIGIAFIGKSEKIDATHTGFVIMNPGEPPRLRHASSLRKRVVEQPLSEYLASRKGKLPGITLFEFLSP